MRIVKTAQGSKLIMTRREYESIKNQVKEAGYLPMLKRHDLESFLKSHDYKLVRTRSHDNWEHKYLPSNHPAKKFQIKHQTELDKGQRDEVISRIGLNPEVFRQHGGFPKNYVIPTDIKDFFGVKKTEIEARPPPEKSRDWRDYQKLPGNHHQLPPQKVNPPESPKDMKTKGPAWQQYRMQPRLREDLL